jgi:hypothetical protein
LCCLAGRGNRTRGPNTWQKSPANKRFLGCARVRSHEIIGSLACRAASSDGTVARGSTPVRHGRSALRPSPARLHVSDERLPR